MSRTFCERFSSNEEQTTRSAVDCNSCHSKPHLTAVENRRPHVPQVGAGADDQQDDGEEAREVEDRAHVAAEQIERMGRFTAEAVSMRERVVAVRPAAGRGKRQWCRWTPGTEGVEGDGHAK